MDVMVKLKDVGLFMQECKFGSSSRKVWNRRGVKCSYTPFSALISLRRALCKDSYVQAYLDIYLLKRRPSSTFFYSYKFFVRFGTYLVDSGDIQMSGEF